MVRQATAAPYLLSRRELLIDKNSAFGSCAAPMSLGDKPLIVLTAGPLPLEVLTSGGLSQEQARQIDELHSESQADLTQRSQNAKQIIAEDSGHYIHVEQPDLVIDAIREVVEAARNGSSV
jgi:pimeloyl-ACP methyl ester carboxylesterase